MKKYKSKYMKSFFIILILMLLFTSVFEFIYNYVQGFHLLSNYFESIGNADKSEGYRIVYYTFKHYIVLISLVILIISVTLYDGYKYRDQLKKQTSTKLDYKAYMHFFLSSFLLLSIIFMLVEPFMRKEYWDVIIVIISIVSIIALSGLGNKRYNNIVLRLSKIKIGMAENVVKENHTYNNYRITSIFYVISAVFLLTLGYKILVFSDYKQYTKYPSEIVIDNDTYFSKDTRIRNNEKDIISFYSNDYLFDCYQLKSISIKINDNTIIDRLEKSDYQILVEYNLEKHYLTKADFRVDRSNNEYQIVINFDENSKQNNIKNEEFSFLIIRFVDNKKEAFEEQPNVKYNITIEKSGILNLSV